jgi:hypothetical protein
VGKVFNGMENALTGNEQAFAVFVGVATVSHFAHQT